MDKRFVSKFDPDDADSLSAFWDAVARRVPDPSTSGLDPDTVALVRRVQRASRIEVPAGGRDQALLAAMRELGGQRDRSNGHERRSEVTTKIISLFPAVGPENSRIESRYGHPTTNSNPGVRRRRLAAAIPLAAVAVLLLALAGNWVPTRLGLFGTNDDGQYSIPAVQLGTNATPSADVPFRNIIIPATYLPAGEIGTDTWDFRQSAGTTERFFDFPWTVSVELAIKGSFGVTSDGPRLIWRAGKDGPPEEVLPGVEAVVAEGDAIAYLDNTPQVLRVIGDEDIWAFDIGFFGQDGNAGETGATGDATIGLREINLEPGESVSAAGEMHVERFVEAGVMMMEVIPAGASTPKANMRFTASVPYTDLPPGTTLVMSNEGDEPLVFLEAAITLPAESGTSKAGSQSADVPFRNIIIPAAYLPAGDTQIRSWEFNLAPGSTEYITIISWVVNVETVSTGSYGVTSEGPRLIWRAGADAPPEEIPAGEEGIVGPGDSIAYLDNAAQSVRVIGDDEVSALVVAFYSEDGNTEALGAAGDATVAVRQVRLETGESVSWPGETHVERLVESGVLTFEVVRTGESTPQGSLTYTENVPFTPFPPGITVVLRNDGDEPLVFLEAVITLSGEDGTPVSATPAN